MLPPTVLVVVYITQCIHLRKPLGSKLKPSEPFKLYQNDQSHQQFDSYIKQGALNRQRSTKQDQSPQLQEATKDTSIEGPCSDAIGTLDHYLPRNDYLDHNPKMQKQGHNVQDLSCVASSLSRNFNKSASACQTCNDVPTKSLLPCKDGNGVQDLSQRSKTTHQSLIQNSPDRRHQPLQHNQFVQEQRDKQPYLQDKVQTSSNQQTKSWPQQQQQQSVEKPHLLRQQEVLVQKPRIQQQLQQQQESQYKEDVPQQTLNQPNKQEQPQLQQNGLIDDNPDEHQDYIWNFNSDRPRQVRRQEYQEYQQPIALKQLTDNIRETDQSRGYKKESDLQSYQQEYLQLQLLAGQSQEASQSQQQEQIYDQDYEEEQYEDPTWEGQEFLTKEQMSEIPLCPNFLVKGYCDNGSYCESIHGVRCQTCKQYKIHPFNPIQARQHLLTCAQVSSRYDKYLKSATVDCSICLEKILQKETPEEKKFGLLNCEHPFCLKCIRQWRTQQGEYFEDNQENQRSCPMCRSVTYFVTPSDIWPENCLEKDHIINSYKNKLRQIDCKYFDFGESKCPFGSSCFYRHAYQDGTLWTQETRKVINANGEIVYLNPVQLNFVSERAP